MAVVYLGLGSNVDPEVHLRAGIAALRAEFGDVALSPVYRSAAVGFEGHDFLNLAARIETARSPAALKQWLAALEDEHGRRRDRPRFSDRTLDIDILLYGDRVDARGESGVELPRREVLEYAHVLGPLADLAPELVHPVTGRTIAEHWRAFSGAALKRVAWAQDSL